MSPAINLPGEKVRPALTPDEVRRLIDARREGASFAELRERFRVSRRLVSETLKAAGVPIVDIRGIR